ncbi:MAG: phage tail tape measure protein, partial [Candidatus Nezhaarchaeales archaeon]
MNKIIERVVQFTAQGLTEMTASLQNLNTQMGVLRKEQTSVNKGFDAMSSNAKKADKGIDETGKSAKRAKGAFSNFGKQLINTAAFLLRFAAVVTAFKALEFAIIGTAKAASEFQGALFDLQAVADVTNSQLDRLEKNTLKVAGSTRFTANEIVALEKSLARLGFSTGQIVESVEPIARFAEATGESADAV